MKIGVVADDITGANDIGCCFRRGGVDAVVYAHGSSLPIAQRDGVVILDIDSRLDTRAVAYRKAYEATRRLMDWGADVFHKKTCSVFRGNIGAEFDAMQDATGERTSYVVLGFPKNGRTTIDGVHYVDGVPLHETQFRRDPIHPMTRSDLRDILSAQTDRRVALVPYAAYDDGLDIDALPEGYAIFDVRDDADLRFLAHALRDRRCLCGSSAIAEYLPEAYGMPRGALTSPPAHDAHLGVLVIGGSLTRQTTAQIDYAARELRVSTLDTRALLKGTDQERALIDVLVDRIARGESAIVSTMRDADGVAETQRMGEARGLTGAQTGKLVSESIARIACAVLRETGARRFVALGGDTSAAVSRALGIEAMHIGAEVAPGVPTLWDERTGYAFVLKSGSFGAEDFVMRAIEALAG